MSGIGKFKLTDALPKGQADDLGSDRAFQARGQGPRPGFRQDQGQGKSKKAKAGKAEGTHDLAAEQLREAHGKRQGQERRRSARGHMVDIGARQSASRQAKGQVISIYQ